MLGSGAEIIPERTWTSVPQCLYESSRASQTWLQYRPTCLVPNVPRSANSHHLGSMIKVLVHISIVVLLHGRIRTCFDLRGIFVTRFTLRSRPPGSHVRPNLSPGSSRQKRKGGPLRGRHSMGPHIRFLKVSAKRWCWLSDVGEAVVAHELPAMHAVGGSARRDEDRTKIM